MRKRPISLNVASNQKHRSKFRKLLVETLEDRRLLTGVPDLNGAILADLNDSVLSSNPTAAVKIQNTVYFSATSEEHGAELWSTDGTTVGSNMVADLVSGPMSGKPRNLTALGNQLIFVSDFSEASSPNQSIGLFSYDGVSVVRLATLTEFSSGMGDNTAIFILGDQAIVLMQNMMGTSLWRTNGQVAGTNLLSNNLITGFTNVLTPSYSSAVLGNVLLINIPVDEMSGTSAVVRTDGTIVGTQVLSNSESSFSPTPLKREIVVAGGKAYFTSNSSLDGLGLYATDGTLVGTSKVMSIGGAFSMAALGSMVAYNGKLFFSYNNGFDGFELWMSDGTTAGTSLAVDLSPGFENGIESSLFVWQGHLYFAGRANGKIELWKSNGTSAGTSLVFDSGTPFGLIPMRFATLPNAIVFDTMDGSLWRSNGTSAGTQKLSDYSGSEYFVAGGYLFYAAQSPGFGRELWRTDGTINGTMRLADLNAGSLDGVDQILAAHNGGVIFRGTGPVGTELGFSDGTVAGTYLIDAAQGTPPANVIDYIAVGNDYYVSARINGLSQLLKVNRTTGAKTVLRTFDFGSAANLAFWNGHVYFAASGQSNQGVELWRTDGTATGTILWKDLNPGSASSQPRNFTVFNNRLFFVATTAATGTEMWEVSLGDARATLYKEFTPGAASSDISAIQVIGLHMYVLADAVLYNTVSTGALNTPPLSVLHSNVARGSLMPWESSLYFAGATPQHGFELWRTNGTVGGTFMVADLVPGPESSYPGGGVSVNFGAESGGAGVESKLIFRASIAENNHQLWATDGTTQGTERLTNYAVTPGAFGNGISYLPVRLNSLGGVVVYEAYDPVNGRELWVSNGTTEGTKLLANLRPGAFPDPNLTVEPNIESWKWEPIRESIVYNGRLYFRLDDGSNGPELWTTDGTVAGTGIAVDLIAGSKGGFPSNFKIFNNRLHFAADTREFGIGSFEGTGEIFLLNEAPKLLSHTAVIAPGTVLNYSLNGYDSDGDVLNYEIISNPSHGIASISTGVLTYTPPVGFSGLVTIQVRATDGSAKSNIATISVSVIANPNRVSFATSQSSIVEQNGAARLIVQLAQPAQELVSIPYTVAGATAIANRNEASGVVTFVAGQQTAELLVYVRENNSYQPGNQQITVTLNATHSVGLGPNGMHTVTIVDNDSRPTVSFPDNWKTIVEEDVVEGIYVGLSNPSDETISVTVSLSANTSATAGLDYMGASQTVVVFAPGQIRKLIPVRILEDILAEDREAIVAGISATTNTSVLQNPDKFRHLLFIQDDDKSTVSLSPSNQILLEGSAAQITLTRSGGNMSLPLQVNYTMQGQAQLGVDYSSPNGTVFSFAPGQTEVTNTFHLNNDGIADGFESFTLFLTSSSGYAFGEQSWSYVGIYDANELAPKLTVSSTSVLERKLNGQDRTVDVSVTLSNPSDKTVTIPVRLRYEAVPPPVQPPPFFPPPPPPPPNSGGFYRRPQSPPPPPTPIQEIIPDSIARLGTDFSFDTTNFVFPPGTTTITRQLVILDDFDIEADEKIGISIDKGAFIVPEANLNAEITVRNDDRNLTFSGPTSIKEGEGSLVITATLDKAAEVGISFPIQISGTANKYGNPRDVTFTGLDLDSPILIFNAGETTKTFTVNVVNDTRIETAKTLTFTARRFSGTVEKIAGTHEVKITDDESPPTVSFGPGDGTRVSYDADNHIIPITLTTAPGVDALVELEFSGTAKLGVDYEVLTRFKPGTQSIEIGANSTEVYLNIRPLIAIDSLPKTVEVSIVKGSNITVPPSTPKTSRTLYSPFAKFFQAQPSSINAVIPGQLPFTIGQSVNIAASNSAGIAPSLNGVSNKISTSTGSLMFLTGAQGLLAGSTSFLDLNFNGRQDFLDLNENLRQDDDEPSEPSATTNADGTFAFTLTPEIDRDGSGFLETSEGRIVLVGGTDTSTALPWEIQLTSPVGDFGVTPLSTLVEHVIRRGSLSLSAAMQRVTEALDIPNYSLGNNLAIHQVLNGDPLAELAYSRQVQISSLAILAGKLAQGAGGSVERGADRAFAAMADRILQNGSDAIYSEVTFVRGVMRAVNNELENPVSEGTLDNLATLIARSLGSLENLNSTQFASPRAYLERVTQIKKLLHGELANDVKACVEGAVTFATLNSKYSNAGINTLIPLQTVGDVVPPAIGVLDAFVIEGNNGQSSLVFEVAMLGEHKLPVSVTYSTRDGSAVVGEDYLATSGILMWAAGDSTSRFVTVPILGDSLSEQDEYVLLRLSQPEGVAVRVADGYGYILNDDAISVSLVGNEGVNRVSIDRSIDQLVVIENNQVIRDMMLAMPSELTLNGSSSTPTAFDVLFSESSLRSDIFEVIGSAQSITDSIALYGSQLESILYGGVEGSNPAFKLQSTNEGGESIVAYQSVEQVESHFDVVDKVQLRIGKQTASATVADANATEAGSSMFTIPGSGFSFRFRNPRSSIQIVSFHPGFSLTPSVLDPSFTGDVQLLRGGTLLSTTTVDKLALLNSTVLSLSTEDPMFIGVPGFELVSGEGDTGNAYFRIEGTALKLVQPLNLLTSSSISIRIKVSNALGESLEQVFLLDLQGPANTSPTNLVLNVESINENLPAQSVVGVFLTVDPDVGDTFTYQLVAGTGDNDNSTFNINGNQLRTNTAFNFEAKATYKIRVRTTDAGGLSFEKELTINVVDLPELVSNVVFGDGTSQRSHITQISFTLDGVVVIENDAVSVTKRGSNGGNVPVTINSTLDANGQTVVTISFSGAFTRGTAQALLDGYYQLSINGSKIKRGVQTLDGNQDGTGGDVIQLGDDEADKFFALFGDTTGDGQVGLIEFGQFRSSFGRSAGQPGYNVVFDYDGGGILLTDFGQFRSRFGRPKLPWQ